MNSADIFAVPVGQKVLIYAPLHDVTAIINRIAWKKWSGYLEDNKQCPESALELFSRFEQSQKGEPSCRSGNLTDPLLLGLIPTRACNMSCRYCDFTSSNPAIMSFDTAKNAIRAYLELLHQNDKKKGEIHFFGGEPMIVPELVQFAVEYARYEAGKNKIEIHFELITNGLYSTTLAQWLSQNFDTVILSVDGFGEFQNRFRPMKNGSPSFETVCNNARFFSDSDCEFVIRSCVFQDNAAHLPQWAEWIGNNLLPSMVCFEPMTKSQESQKNEIFPAKPVDFVQKFCTASDILKNFGIPVIFSTTDITKNTNSICPLGQDALIISPEGSISSCYQLETEWKRQKKDLAFGWIDSEGFHFDMEKVNQCREFSVHNKRFCENCFCKYHCTGGCHLSHNTDKVSGLYDDFCIETRMISAAFLLDELNQSALKEEWLSDEDSIRIMAAQSSDRWLDYRSMAIAEL
jgi:uncharacterized protein